VKESICIYDSQEVVGGSLPGRGTAGFLWGCLKYLVEFGQVLIEFEDGCDVSAPVAIVGRGPNGY